MKKLTISIAIGVIVLSGIALANKRRSSVATLSTGGASGSSFCAVTGNILIVNACQGEDRPNFSTCAIGRTKLTGSTTLELGAGSHSIPTGCYSHALVNTTVTGGAKAVSTLWYDAKD